MHYKAQEVGGKQKESQNGNACSSSVFSLAEVHGPEMWFINMESSPRLWRQLNSKVEMAYLAATLTLPSHKANRSLSG